MLVSTESWGEAPGSHLLGICRLVTNVSEAHRPGAMGANPLSPLSLSFLICSMETPGATHTLIQVGMKISRADDWSACELHASSTCEPGWTCCSVFTRLVLSLCTQCSDSASFSCSVEERLSELQVTLAIADVGL